MDRYGSLLLDNERDINRRTSMISVYELCVVIVVYLLDDVGLFTIYSFATHFIWKAVLVAVLLLPWLLTWAAGIEGKWLKYIIMTCSVLASGLCYIIFNVQAMLLLLFPTVVVTLYYDRSLSYYTSILTIAVLFLSYLTASYLLLPVRYQNPFGFRYVMVDTAIPQALYYVCFVFLLQLLNRRTLGMLRDVNKTSQENEILSLEKETAEMRGRMDERERISRDIQNNVGHTITAAIFALEAANLQRAADPEAADEMTERAIERMRESMETIRNSVRVLDDDNVLTLQDLLKILTLCCRQTELNAEVMIETDYSGVAPPVLEAPFSSDRVSFLYGTVQECVSNAMRHGGARHIRLRVVTEENRLRVELWNDGACCCESAAEEGYGLKKIRQYAENVGGSLEILREEGFTVSVLLPVESI